MAKKRHNKQKLPAKSQPENPETNNKAKNQNDNSQVENLEEANELFFMAITLCEHGQYGEAIHIFKRIESFFEKDTDFYAKFAECCYHLYDYDAAFKYIEKAISLGDADPNILNMLASIYFHDENYQLGFEALNKLISIDPKNHLAYYNRGQARVSLNDVPLAIEDFKTAVKLDPTQLKYHLTLLEFELKTQNFSDVIKDASHSIQHHDDPSIHFMLGMAYISSCHFDIALVYLKKCFQYHPKNENFYRMFNDIYAQLKFTQKFQPENGKLLTLYFKEWIIYNTYLDAYEEDTIYSLREISDSTFIITLYASKVYYLRQQLVYLLQDKTASPALEEKAANFFYQIGVEYSNCGNFCLAYRRNSPNEISGIIPRAYFEKAIEFFLKASAIGKSANFELGLAHLSIYESQLPNVNKEPLEKAIKYFEAAVHNEGNSTFQLARDYFKNNEVIKALLEVRNFLKSDIATKKFIPGQICFARKCYAQAVEEFSLVINTHFIDPKPEYYFLRGVAHLELNNFAAANDDLQKALDLAEDETLIYLDEYKKRAPHINFQHPELKSTLIRGTPTFPDPDQESPLIPTLCSNEGEIDNKADTENNKIYFPQKYSFWDWEEAEPQEEKPEENNSYRFP